MLYRAIFCLFALSIGWCGHTRAAVVINEIFYHAPDDWDDLEWIELHNASNEPADVGGWELQKDARCKLPAGTTIPADGYLVICRDEQRFKQFYPGVPALAGLTKPLSGKGAHIVLVDAAGKIIDQVRYKDRPPWPMSPDGDTASLERICPAASGELAENWAASPLSDVETTPAGTPAKRNAAFCPDLPPVISKVTCTPAQPAPKEPARIEAEVNDPANLRDVTLLYRIVGPSSVGKEEGVAMARDEKTGRYAAAIPGQDPGKLIRYRIKATNRKNAMRLYPAEHELRPTFSLYIHDKLEPGTIPLGFIINVGSDPGVTPKPQPRKRSIWGIFGGSSQPEPSRGKFAPADENLPPRGTCAFIYVDQKTHAVTLFDHISVTDRSGGYKVRFHKDQTLNGMSTINLILEQNERFVLAEPLSYELFRRVGSPAPLTDFVRLSVDGKPRAYHLLIEQPNKSFLRRNKLKDDGNLYKLLWYGSGIVGQHEKKTNRHGNHEDLLQAIQSLQKTKGDEQWQFIQQNFDVQEFVNYYAVNMVLSDWDGFFNNFFTYHETSGSKKWHIFPWDRDKTWGYHDGTWGDAIFTDMPLTFGMEGDRPPGGQGGGFGGGFGFGGNAWWRPGGYFSRPMLANPQFRKLFLARTRQILDTIYTEQVFFPILDQLEQRLEPEVRLRGQIYGNGPDAEREQLRRNINSLKRHLVERRKFLLSQKELRMKDEG